MAGDCHTIAAEPRKPKSLMDLGDDFNRIRNLIRVIGITTQKPTCDDDRAISELCWTIEERCEAFAADLKASEKGPGHEG